jgi:hypothetical protein
MLKMKRVKTVIMYDGHIFGSMRHDICRRHANDLPKCIKCRAISRQRWGMSRGEGNMPQGLEMDSGEP